MRIVQLPYHILAYTPYSLIYWIIYFRRARPLYTLNYSWAPYVVQMFFFCNISISKHIQITLHSNRFRFDNTAITAFHIPTRFDFNYLRSIYVCSTRANAVNYELSTIRVHRKAYMHLSWSARCLAQSGRGPVARSLYWQTCFIIPISLVFGALQMRLGQFRHHSQHRADMIIE